MQVPDLPLIASDAAIDLARECVYRFLSAVMTDPYDQGWSRVLQQDWQWLAVAAADLLREAAEDGPGDLACGELAPVDLDLRPLIAELNRPGTEVRGDYDRVFGLLVPQDCPPYETEYHPPAQTFLRSQELADIAGFYRAFGLAPRAAAPERPDHLALELEFLAVLLTKKRMALDTADTNPSAQEQAGVCDQAHRAFVRDHLCWWVPVFAAGLRRKACCGYLHELGTVLATLIPVERRLLGIDPPSRTPPPPELIEPPEEQSGCEACPLHA